MPNSLLPNFPNQSHRPRVLVVDDVRTNLAVATALLEPLDLDVLQSDNGPHALELARAHPQPDLILLDVMMPGMDGHQVLAALRADPTTRDIPVIYVTALESPQDEEACLLEGAADFISKPLQGAVFQARVSQQLELKRHRDLLASQTEWLADEVKRRVAENRDLSARLHLAIAAAGLGVWEYDHARDVMRWSETLTAMLGLAEAPATLQACLARIHPDEREHFLQAMLPSAEVERHIAEFRIQHADGHWVWLEGRGRTLARDAQGQPLQTVGTMADITQRKDNERQQQLAAAMLAGINDAICVVDPQGAIVLVNAAFSRMSGYTAEELIGRSPSLLKSGVHGRAYYEGIWQALSLHDAWQGEITNRSKDGELVTEWLNISVVRDAAGQLLNYVAIYTDLSDRKAAAARLQYLSSFDALTGLPNRSLLSDRLGQALLNAPRFDSETAFFLLDLDRFSQINDSYGAQVGDEVLIEVGRRLRGQIREGDTLGRLSANEFGLVLPHLHDEPAAIQMAQRILAGLAEPMTVLDHTLNLTACLGVAIAPRDGESVEAVLRSAATALSRAKQAGHGAVRFYSPAMDASAARRHALELALPSALTLGELSLVYQPQVSLESGNMIGVEVFVRWHSPTLGTVSPAEFIPVAEESGYIVQLGEWILRSACLQVRRWLDLGLLQLRLAVNLSSRQFRQLNLVSVVQEALAFSGLPPSQLELEITEHAFIDDAEQALATCRALKALGVKLSLDDFGTGYSSLSYVAHFPFDRIKIDRTFIQDLTENPVNAAVATSAIIMARSLNLSVMAEGVETEEQAKFLRGRRCDAMQGYLFSHPLPATEFEQLLAHRKTLPLSAMESHGAQTLLVVDDEANILSALTRLFRREGYQILTAQSPTQALELLAAHPVQVVISDQRMPDMSGTEFLARVRQTYPDTVRIVLTGYTDLDSVTSAVNRGAIYKFLTKPWDDDQLREEVREAFRLAQLQQEARQRPPELS